jgi:hypothetical protein
MPAREGNYEGVSPQNSQAHPFEPTSLLRRSSVESKISPGEGTMGNRSQLSKSGVVYNPR